MVFERTSARWSRQRKMDKREKPGKKKKKPRLHLRMNLACCPACACPLPLSSSVAVVACPLPLSSSVLFVPRALSQCWIVDCPHVRCTALCPLCPIAGMCDAPSLQIFWNALTCNHGVRITRPSLFDGSRTLSKRARGARSRAWPSGDGFEARLQAR